MNLAASRGAFGENIARSYLEKQGLRFIIANWWCKLGELDLIMQDGYTRVFVEVRLRSSTQYGLGSETVAWQKQQKLMRAAQFYQQQEGYWDDVRFDVVSITMNDEDAPEVEHIKYAF